MFTSRRELSSDKREMKKAFFAPNAKIYTDESLYDCFNLKVIMCRVDIAWRGLWLWRRIATMSVENACRDQTSRLRACQQAIVFRESRWDIAASAAAMCSRLCDAHIL